MSSDGADPPQAPAQYRHYYKAAALATMLFVSTATIYFFIDSPVIAPAARILHQIANRTMIGQPVTPQILDLTKICSGRGILTHAPDNPQGKCLCDIGWSGDTCHTRVVHTAAKGGSVLLVVDWFTASPATAPLFPSLTAPLSTLAGFMARSGLSLTILVTEGDAAGVGASERRIFERQFPNAQLKYLHTNSKKDKQQHRQKDRQFSMTQSASVLRYLAAQSTPYEYVLFTGHQGIGYATLSAVRQGYHCIPSLFAVLMDGPTDAQRLEQVNNLDKADYVVTDQEAIKRDYMHQRAVELADVVIAPNRMVLDLIGERQWRLPESVYHLPMLTLPVASSQHHLKEATMDDVERADELLPARQQAVREFVYIGPLGAEGGLQVFLGAIDALLARDARAHRKLLGKAKHVKVTFFGYNAVADEEEGWTGEHLLEQRALAWGNRVRWSVSREQQLKRIFAYLMDPGKGRLAVLPSPHDASTPTTFFLHQALRAGVPVIAANLRSAQELVHLQDRRDCLFPVNDAGGLARRMAEAWANGILLARPQVSLRHLETQWRQLLADLNARPAHSCPADTTLKPANNDTLISVVLVHHNRPDLLKQAIRSLEQQSIVNNIQVVLVDDGSTDPEADVLLSELAWRWWQERGWKVLREPNRYLGAARNTGARHARGKYLMFMDDDDLAKAGKAEAMLRVAEWSGADIVTCGHDTFTGPNLQLPLKQSTRYLPVGASKSLGVLENCFGDASFLVHRQFFLDSGGFTEEYGVGFEDYEYLAKMAVRDNHIETVPDALNLYRQHHAGSMSQETDLKANQMRFMRAYLDMFSGLGRPLQRLVRHAQYVYFERDGPKPFFYQNCGCNSTCTDEPVTTSASSSSSSSSTSVTTSTFTDTSSTGIITSSTFFTTDFTFNSTTPSTSTSPPSSSSSSLSSDSTTSTLSTTEAITRQCPCRSVRKRRTQPTQQQTRSQRPTCYTTATITPTITRFARGCTVLTTVELPPMCSGPDCYFYNGTTLIPPPGQPSAYTLTTTQRLLDQAPPRPPLARYAEFLPNGAQIAVQFDAPVNAQVGLDVPCHHYLDTRPLHIPNGAVLATSQDADQDCRAIFVSPVEMRLAVSGRWLAKEQRAARPQLLLLFRPNILGNVGTMNRAFVSGTVEIVAPEQPVRPVVIIDGPAGVVFGGVDVKFDLSRSIGSAGRPFTDFQFDITSTGSSGSTGGGFMDAPLQQLLQSAAIDAIKHHRLSFTIPSALLQDYVTYTLHCSLWNFLHQVGSATITFSKVPADSNTRQQVALGRRPVIIIGPKAASRSSPIILSVVAADQKRFKYYWFPIKTPLGVKIKNAARPSIQFDPNQLASGRYVIGLRTLDLHEQSSEFVYTHQFDVHIGQPAAHIQGGSRQIGSADTVTLLPVVHDLTPLAHNAVYSPDTFNYTWRCYQADRQSPCQHRLTGAIIDYQVDPVSGGILFDAAALAVGEYEVEMVASSSEGVVSPASAVIVVSAEPHLPIVALHCDTPLPGTSDPDIYISAHIAGSATLKDSLSVSRQYTYTWESLPYCAGQYYATIPNLAHRTSKSNQTHDTLSLPAAALLPGASYCFRVTTADLATGRRSFAFHTITARQVPEGGWCELSAGSAAVGEALRTVFNIGCHGWTADPASPQLLYQLQARRRRGDTITLSAFQDRPTFTTTLDVGHYQLVVIVKDEFGSRVEVPVRQVSMRVPVGVDLSEQRAAFIQGRHLVEEAKDEELLGVVAGFPPAVRQDMNNTLLSTVFAAMDRMAAGSQPHQALFLLDTLQRVSPAKLSVDLRPQALKVLARVAGHMRDGKLCSVEMAQRVIAAMQPVMANPRGGTAASFLYHDLVGRVEECLAGLTGCDTEPISIVTRFQSWKVGWLNTNSSSVVDLQVGTFNLPRQLSQLSPCLQYRYISTTGNLMRNATIDTNTVELRFTNNTTPLSPWFNQPLSAMNVTFTIDLSKEAQRKIAYRRVIPHCVWFDRGANASASWWSGEGCEVVAVCREKVTCACSHLTEFAVLLEERGLAVVGFWWRTKIVYIIALGMVLGVSMVLLVKVVMAKSKRRDAADISNKKRQEATDDTDTIHNSIASLQSSASTLNPTELTEE